jgi:hypothetical protein
MTVLRDPLASLTYTPVGSGRSEAPRLVLRRPDDRRGESPDDA